MRPKRKNGIAFAYTFTGNRTDLLVQENKIFMKFDMTKAHTIDVRYGLPFSMSGRMQFIKDSSHGNLSALFQRLFKIFSHEEKNSPIDNEKIASEFADNTTEKKENETRSLQQLEDCANAARETEAHDQYEWFNKSDE